MCRAQGQGTQRGDDLRLTGWTGARTGVGEGSCYFQGTATTATAQAADRIAAGEVGRGEWKLERVGKRATRKRQGSGAAMNAGR